MNDERPPDASRARSVRAFFALWPDDPARERLAAVAADVALAGAGRVVAAANLHLTVAFVGAVASGRVESLADAGAHACVDAHRFELVVDRIGGAHGGELVWIASTTLPAELGKLHRSLTTSLRERGFAIEERAFRAHVTLARRCTRRVANVVAPAIGWRVERLALMASTTRAGGSEYRELASWPLAA